MGKKPPIAIEFADDMREIERFYETGYPGLVEAFDPCVASMGTDYRLGIDPAVEAVPALKDAFEEPARIRAIADAMVSIRSARLWRASGLILRFHPALRDALWESDPSDLDLSCLATLPSRSLFLDVELPESQAVAEARRAASDRAYVDEPRANPWKGALVAPLENGLLVTLTRRFSETGERPVVPEGVYKTSDVEQSFFVLRADGRFSESVRDAAEAMARRGNDVSGFVEAYTELIGRVVLLLCYLGSVGPDLRERPMKKAARRRAAARSGAEEAPLRYIEAGYVAAGPALERSARYGQAGGRGRGDGPKVRPHLRRGHWRRTRTGPRDAEPTYVWHFILPTVVNADLGEPVPTVRTVGTERDG